MIVEFAPETGRLRLDLEAFDVLVGDRAAAPPGPASGEGALMTAGLVDADGAVHPTIQPAVEAVRAPVCLVDLSVAGENTITTHRMWVGAQGAACLLHVTDGVYQVFVVPPAAVPALVAKGVGLGPRPRLADATALCPAAAVTGLTSPDRSHVAWSLTQLADACPPEWVAFVDNVRAGRWRLWSARSTWPGPDLAPGGRSITVLDTPAGMALIPDPAEAASEAAGSAGAPESAEAADAPRAAVLSPTTPTAVWVALAGLLPADAELPGPVA